MKAHEVRPGQSLGDIAIEVYGSIAGIHFLLEDNNAALNNSLDTVPFPGTLLVIRESNPVDALASFTAAELSRNKNKLGSAPNQVPSEFVLPNYVIPNYVE